MDLSNEAIISRMRLSANPKPYLEELYTKNLPLIRQWLQPFVAYVELDDLLQEAFFSVYEAASRYEIGETPFAGYLRYWVRQSAIRYLESNISAVRLPSHLRQKILKLKKAVESFEKTHGREPADADLSIILSMSIPEIRKLKSCQFSIISVDAPVAPDESTKLVDTLADERDTANIAVDHVFEASKKDLWRLVQGHTQPLENDAIVFRFQKGMSFRDVADQLGISTQRAQQLVQTGLRRIRAPKLLRRLKERYELADSMMYCGGFSTFNRTWNSSTELVALRRQEASPSYERQMKAEMKRLKNSDKIGFDGIIIC